MQNQKKRIRTELEQSILTLWFQCVEHRPTKRAELIAARFNQKLTKKLHNRIITPQYVLQVVRNRFDTIAPQTHTRNMTREVADRVILDYYYLEDLTIKEIYAHLAYAYVNCRRITEAYIKRTIQIFEQNAITS